MSASKRSREGDGSDDGVKIDIDRLLESDPKQIAALGRHDDDLLSKLEKFSDELDREVLKIFKRAKRK
ncbi:hypothetical protein ACHAWF_011239 [Thalassiosira exigua]